ncbi:MAG: hypothetical protein A2583_15615 [Bdellovibrionales bacterium RIFOXYD1_FULL_53_11]|nr:MAG: hypothetical protein A2583_15615 [Bdellovibrionales bacterium RIFOXYD1_FULL_53_11]
MEAAGHSTPPQREKRKETSHVEHEQQLESQLGNHQRHPGVPFRLPSQPHRVEMAVDVVVALVNGPQVVDLDLIQ